MSYRQGETIIEWISTIRFVLSSNATSNNFVNLEESGSGFPHNKTKLNKQYVTSSLLSSNEHLYQTMSTPEGIEPESVLMRHFVFMYMITSHKEVLT